FELRVAVNPVLGILIPDFLGFRHVRNLTIALHDTSRSRDSSRRAEREHGRGWYAGVGIGIYALLRHRSRARVVRLQIPIGFVERLPDAAEVWLAVRCACRPRRLAGCSRHRYGD